MAKRNGFLPQGLGERPDLKQNSRYRQIGSASSFEQVSVTHSHTVRRDHAYSVPDGEGVISRRLRRFGLALSRYSLPMEKYAKRWKVSEMIVGHTNRMVASYIHQKAYGDDPTEGTFSPEPLMALLKETNPPMSALTQAMALWGSIHYRKVMDDLLTRHPELGDAIKYAEHQFDWIFMRQGERLHNINSDSTYLRKQALRAYRDVANVLAFFQDQAKSAEVQRNGKRSQSRPQEVKREMVDGAGDGWEDLMVAKPELPIPHSGRAGRRIIPTQIGRFARYFQRIVTDPEQRVFSRKTHALGGTVVIDCSGSMSLSDSDLRRLMRASSGCTVLCYSHGWGEGANAWVVARNGRQIRHLPHFPGGNGVDGPALVYAHKHLRRTAKHPMIWVSDEQVTGRGDIARRELRRQTDGIKKRYNIKVVRRVRDAERLLAKLQGKG